VTTRANGFGARPWFPKPCILEDPILLRLNPTTGYVFMRLVELCGHARSPLITETQLRRQMVNVAKVGRVIEELLSAGCIAKVPESGPESGLELDHDAGARPVAGQSQASSRPAPEQVYVLCRPDDWLSSAPRPSPVSAGQSNESSDSHFSTPRGAARAPAKEREEEREKTTSRPPSGDGRDVVSARSAQRQRPEGAELSTPGCYRGPVVEPGPDHPDIRKKAERAAARRALASDEQAATVSAKEAARALVKQARKLYQDENPNSSGRDTELSRWKQSADGTNFEVRPIRDYLGGESE
jgi:hypothetical protein